MNVFPRLTALLLASGMLHADETAVDQPLATGIPGPIADGTPSLAVEKPAPIPFTVLNSVTKRVHVTESPEMPGLPPVQGTIKRTVQLVADPGLPDPPPPLPPLPLEDAAVQGRLAEAREKYKETQILFVSARVLDFDKTILEVHPNGEGKQSVTVVSSIDYNDFSGFATFNVAGDTEDGDGIPDLIEARAGADPTTNQSANPTERTDYQYDAMGRLTEAGGVSYIFDIEGNLESSN